MGKLLELGEVVITGRGMAADGQWVAAGLLQVRRGRDVRDVNLLITGKVFPTQLAAITAGIHEGIA